MRRHAVLMAVRGCGVLITGPAGAGKSQLGLELLDRGHRFVADDQVELRRTGDELIGRGDAELGGFLALRCGLIVDVAAHFGAASVLAEHPVHLCLSPGPAQDPFAPAPAIPLLGIKLPRHHLEILPGSAIVVEALARAWILAGQGTDAAATLAARQARTLRRRSA